MRQFVNIFTVILFGLAPLMGAIIIGFVIYNSFTNSIVLFIDSILCVLAIWLGIHIFKKVQVVGPIEFMTVLHSTRELDNLDPDENSETKRRQPEEFVNLLNKKENLFKGGTLRIYGDWFGKPYDNYHEIIIAHFDNKLKILTLNFKEGEKIEIYNPINIFESSTFLKIIKAERIKFTWYCFGKPISQENLYYLDYKVENNKIKTDTDVDWYKPKFNVSLSEPALIIYG